jgi:hypothetical protein
VGTDVLTKPHRVAIYVQSGHQTTDYLDAAGVEYVACAGCSHPRVDGAAALTALAALVDKEPFANPDVEISDLCTGEAGCRLFRYTALEVRLLRKQRALIACARMWRRVSFSLAVALVVALAWVVMK